MIKVKLEIECGNTPAIHAACIACQETAAKLKIHTWRISIEPSSDD